jgi:predicted lipoprotein with Yx(FWY)xxD motif
MKRLSIVVAILVLAAVWAGAAYAGDSAVKVTQKEGIGAYLTDAKGATLYWFKKDSPGKSACAGPCVAKWPVYYQEKVEPPEGLKEQDFATITRDDGIKQTTFRGYPLYYWSADEKPGETKGNNFNGVWFVIDPSKFPPK